MKKILCAVLAVMLLTAPAMAIDTLKDGDIEIAAPSAVLMEKTSGQVIYEKNAHERMAPASVTKVMTLLLIVEAVENGDISLNDMVTASARAASFGGMPRNGCHSRTDGGKRDYMFSHCVSPSYGIHNAAVTDLCYCLGNDIARRMLEGKTHVRPIWYLGFCETY